MSFKTSLPLLALFFFSSTSPTSLTFGLEHAKTKLPDAFSVYWNAPSESCENRGIHLDLDKYGIKHNNHLAFKGSVISLFYADYKRFGAFPYISKDGQEINGGIPQKANITLHLELIAKELDASLDKDFDGLAIFDWEIWRPIFNRNWGQMRIYQKKSIDYVRARYPTLSVKATLAKATAEWNFSAKILLGKTLELATYMRPKAQWGFYKFPECYNYGAKYPWCDKQVVMYNDHLSWMWNASTALFPSAYFGNGKPPTFEQKKNLAIGHIKEAIRVGTNGNTTLPVYFYMKYSYGSTIFATPDDLEASMQVAAHLGADGVILWDASAPFKDHSYCNRLQGDLETLLGPFSQRVIEEASDCSIIRCSGRGRCVMNDENAYIGPYIYPSSVELMPSDFHCRCFNGWTGSHCENNIA